MNGQSQQQIIPETVSFQCHLVFEDDLQARMFITHAGVRRFCEMQNKKFSRKIIHAYRLVDGKCITIWEKEK